MNKTDFLEIRFPDDISYGSVGGPMFSTMINATKSGIEYRNINWPYARSKFNVIYSIKSQKNLLNLLSFFRIVKGRAYGFRFKDWSDYRAQNSELIELNKENKLFALQKKYSYGDHVINRRIYKPIESSVRIFKSESGEDVDFELDPTTGIVSILSEIEDEEILLSDFEFDIPARFDSDILNHSIDSFNSRSCSIDIIEILI